ncbi:MAG: HAMP domain-containing sensor histidine kinase [Polyangia bacterium]
MLHDFIVKNRTELIRRCRLKLAGRATPRVTELELEQGVPLFLDQFVEIVRAANGPSAAMSKNATRHGASLLHRGFTVGQLVHDYGGICQAITELAVETKAPISSIDFKTLNLCLDDSIAGAVTEFGRLRAEEGSERTGRLAHEIGGLLHSASLAFEVLKSGEVGMGGSTSRVIDRCFIGLRKIVERELAEVRIGSGVLHPQTIVLREFLDEVAATAMLDADSRGIVFSSVPFDDGVTVQADHHVLASVLANLLHNAFKFTRAGGRVVLRAKVAGDRVRIDVEDECGGLASDDTEALFQPYEQAGADLSGMGLGLSICRTGARSSGGDITVKNLPGTGCIFTLELPQNSALTDAA